MQASGLLQSSERIFAMANVVKVIEVLAESNKSWEDAATQALRKASKTLKNIKSIYIKELEAKVENNKITQYRINGKISFTLD
jgi:dodecin